LHFTSDYDIFCSPSGEINKGEVMFFISKEKPRESAFTRLELIIILVALTVFVLIALPRSVSARNSSQRMTCMDNLRRMGQAFQLWAFEHQDSVPWTLSVTEGGTRPPSNNGKLGNAWFEFYVLANELGTPKILFCPNDERSNARAAWDWTSSPTGYLNSAYRNNATSYVIGLHALFESPDAVLSLDRFLSVDVSGSASCSMGVNNASAVIYPRSSAAWTNITHGRIGNFLLVDGRVIEVPNSQLSRSLGLNPRDDVGGTTHLLIP
jgi:competence protein ComGC